MTDSVQRSAPLIVFWVATVASAILVSTIIVFVFREEEPTVVTFSPIRIAEQVEAENGDTEGVTEVVPVVEGVDGPAVVGSVDMCADDEGCFTVPLLFEMTNHTAGDVVSETLGQWHNVEFGRSCGSSETPFQLVSPPGITTIAFPSQPPRCVVDDLREFVEMGVTESVWQITAVIEPIGRGLDSATDSQNFTIVVSEE